MPSALRRLAADHAALHDDLPPNYLFPAEDSDDLTQLSILLAGPQGTPFTQGLWRLHLKMPEDYPKSPPKATFRTRIWHPNVEEKSGAVCVDTLKRDWRAELTLKDVLVTISCLLIYPNPDSALNSAAGALLQEDYEAFARQAKLMTSIHAPVPADMSNAVMEAKLKGEDAGAMVIQERQQEDSHSLQSRKGTRVQSVTMKKKPTTENKQQQHQHQQPQQPVDPTPSDNDENENDENDENDDENNISAKENDPSLSPSPVKFAPPSPRKNAHGKRPLSVLTMPMEHDPFTTSASASTKASVETDDEEMLTASEKNIAANHHGIPEEEEEQEQEHDSSSSPPQRKSPKLSVLNKGTNASGRIRDDINANNVNVGIFEDASPPTTLHRRTSGDGKENPNTTNTSISSMTMAATGAKEQSVKTSRKNHPSTSNSTINHVTVNNSVNNPPVLAPSAPAPAMIPSSSKNGKSAATGTRKVSSRQKPRIGIRRL